MQEGRGFVPITTVYSILCANTWVYNGLKFIPISLQIIIIIIIIIIITNIIITIMIIVITIVVQTWLKCISGMFCRVCQDQGKSSPSITICAIYVKWDCLMSAYIYIHIYLNDCEKYLYFILLPLLSNRKYESLATFKIRRLCYKTLASYDFLHYVLIALISVKR